MSVSVYAYRYDPSRNAWSKLAPLQHKRSRATAVVMNGQLYVIGGTDGNTTLDSGADTNKHPIPISERDRDTEAILTCNTIIQNRLICN